MNELRRAAALGVAVTVAVTGTALFASAGSVAYWQAWVVLAVLAAATTAIAADLLARDPALLRRRLAVGVAAEPEPLQRILVGVGDLAFVAVFVCAGLDRRFGWSHVPGAASLAGDLAVTAGLGIIACALRANSFAAATVAVVAEQRLATRGPYAVVRHPMYAGGLLMLCGLPFALGSWPAALPVAALAVLIVRRLLAEERLLRRALPGYDAYARAVRARLVPGVW